MGRRDSPFVPLAGGASPPDPQRGARSATPNPRTAALPDLASGLFLCRGRRPSRPCKILNFPGFRAHSGRVLCRKSDFPSLEARREARKVKKPAPFPGRTSRSPESSISRHPEPPAPPGNRRRALRVLSNRGGAPPYEMTFTPKSRRCACTNRTLSNPGSVSFSFCELFRLETPFPHPLANRMSSSDRAR